MAAVDQPRPDRGGVAVALFQLMRLKGYSANDVEAVVISSVVPQTVIGLRWMSRDFFGCRAFVVGEDLDYPIKINLNNPREVGADRVVNAPARQKALSAAADRGRFRHRHHLRRRQ